MATDCRDDDAATSRFYAPGLEVFIADKTGILNQNDSWYCFVRFKYVKEPYAMNNAFLSYSSLTNILLQYGRSFMQIFIRLSRSAT